MAGNLQIRFIVRKTGFSKITIFSLALGNSFEKNTGLPGAFIGQDIVLQDCRVTGLSSSVHSVLGC